MSEVIRGISVELGSTGEIQNIRQILRLCNLKSAIDAKLRNSIKVFSRKDYLMSAASVSLLS